MERPTSPEVTGGAGFGFEDAVVASYLCSVLLEAGVRGLREHVATGVDVQRGALGHPLDDLIVHGRNVSGAKGRLELQVKQTLTVSSARSNRAFRDVVRRAWRTLHDPSFQKGASRVGAVTSSISDKSYRAVTSTC